MSDISLRLGSLLLALASIYTLTSARPQIGNVFQRWDVTPRQARVIGIAGLIGASVLFVYTLR